MAKWSLRNSPSRFLNGVLKWKFHIECGAIVRIRFKPYNAISLFDIFFYDGKPQSCPGRFCGEIGCEYFFSER